MTDNNLIFIGDQFEKFICSLKNGKEVTFANNMLFTGQDGPTGLYGALEFVGEHATTVEVHARRYHIVDVPTQFIEGQEENIEAARTKFTKHFNEGHYFTPPTSTAVWAQWTQGDLSGSSGEDGFEFDKLYAERNDLLNVFFLQIDLFGGDTFYVQCHGVTVFNGYFIAYFNSVTSEGVPHSVPLAMVAEERLIGIFGVPKSCLDIPHHPDGFGNYPERRYGVLEARAEASNINSLSSRRVLVGKNISSFRLEIVGNSDIILSTMVKSVEADEISSLGLTCADPRFISIPRMAFILTAFPFASGDPEELDATDPVNWLRDAYNCGMYYTPPISTAIWNRWLSNGRKLSRSSQSTCFEEFFIEDSEFRLNIIQNRIDLSKGQFFLVRCHGIVMFEGYAVAYINGFSHGEPLSLPVAAVRDEVFAGLGTVPKEELNIPAL